MTQTRDPHAHLRRTWQGDEGHRDLHRRDRTPVTSPPLMRVPWPLASPPDPVLGQGSATRMGSAGIGSTPLDAHHADHERDAVA